MSRCGTTSGAWCGSMACTSCARPHWGRFSTWRMHALRAPSGRCARCCVTNTRDNRCPLGRHLQDARRTTRCRHERCRRPRVRPRVARLRPELAAVSRTRALGHPATARPRAARRSQRRDAPRGSRRRTQRAPGRINERYTNVALMHAWLQHACGVAPDGLAAAVAAQVRDDGDIAEYNSPTYDAISLLAASLLVDYASDPALQELGRLVRQRVALDSLPCGTTRSACRPARIRGRTVSTRACTCRSCQCS